jgi:enoyl-CoA hydratase/carnithine racemase
MNVRLEKDDAVATLTLDRPDKLNAMALPTLEMLMETETLASGIARLTHDHPEGVASFREKRPPRFLGR